MGSPRVIISGGGTGGHIFPAVAIANAIKALEPNADILFVGAKGKMEMEKVPAAGYPIRGLWISGLQRKLTPQNLAFPFKVISSLINARKIIKEFKPQIAIGVGGFASGPLLKAAASMGIPTMIQEQNSFPGITNKILAPKARKICVAYDGMEKWFPEKSIIKTGNPVRREMVAIEGKRQTAESHFNLKPGITTLFFMGGSLGARTINHAVKAMLPRLANLDVQVIWQTGKLYHQQALEDVRQAEASNIRVHEFIREMDLAYAAADIIISRAGAMSISELCLIGKPAIFVPLPHAAEDHQTKNAQALVDRNAGILVKDAQCIEELPTVLEQLISDLDRRDRLGTEILRLGLPGADEEIARIALNIIDHN
ncbi:MAG: undecaprenyldiphospho-muramoylpentapeptide beta-N-acetylglucosaminyltransferase [Flavobacteriales bacterium]|nr:undecaprenyldiphospho-muramoylpentapeptide beta-N-acetylglucosaminyltransferase [Flavobacteriales bacterium]